jgi:antitoxin YefM
MQVISMKEVQSNFARVFDNVYYDNEEVIIHRKNKENIVMISLEEYNSIKETDYLLKSPKNREILLHSLKEAREGKVQNRELIEE